MARPPTLKAKGIRLRPLRKRDLPVLLDILTDPTVAAWWGRYDRKRVRREYGSAADREGMFLVRLAGEPVGMIQFGEEDDPEYRHASIDIALRESAQGRGVGPRAVWLLARYLIEERGHHRVTIDPAVANRNAIRAYEKVGFREVGVMRNYERGSDGTWHDGLLMDVLADELRDPGI